MVGAVAAVSVGLIGLTAIGAGLADGPVHPLARNAPWPADPSGVTPTGTAPASLSTTPSMATTGPEPPGGTRRSEPASPPPVAGTAAGHTVATRGGTVIARCNPNDAYIIAWSPAPGYRSDDVVRGPAPWPSVTFVAPGDSVKIVVHCVNGLVQPDIKYGSADDHGDD